MTTLGLIFVVAYALGFVFGRRVGLLAVAAAAVPFNDSSAIIFGDITISPFYLGMLAYLPLTYLRNGVPRPGSSLPVLLGVWATAITLVGPALFAGMPVVASGMGLDEQVSRLSELGYTSSNFAQVTYLLLNLALLVALASSQDTKRWIPPIAAVVGTLVATLAWSFEKAGMEWPDEIFHNNTRNAYAYVASPRLAAQFSEPSHLGAFALTSAVMLTAIALLQETRPVAKVVLLALVAADVVLIVESASATALGGAGIFALIAILWGLYRMTIKGGRVSPTGILTVLVFAAFTILLMPRAVALINDVVEYKLARGTSIRGRGSADASGWRVFLDSGALGVGLGSNRSSSLLILLLSAGGLLGTLLFLLIMGRAIRDGLRERTRIPWAAGLVVLLLAEFFSYADLVSPMMWLLAGFCWNASAVFEGRPKQVSRVQARSQTDTQLVAEP
ncbi:hypothetical protein ASD37_07700 [Mycobacterium sp. Root135]|uniref:O-antigen ligase family protein n=1 Tax=Mycobacterium sp. Root135 TaxID=1736457 RepID=UPI0006F928E4|nr:hypothetical protein [Mycobacterium sp. Root135]KQY07866.1 hypothetical protein ASD37_07700 [Mycobacterium sp. Root135]